MCLRLVTAGASPFKTASKNLAIIFKELPETQGYKTPSHSTIKRWMQKVGYYKLKKMDIPKGDWMVIIDASIQMGDQKCLIVLGCPANHFPQGRALTLKDLTPLAMHVVRGLNAKVVEKTLREVKKIVGNIVSINSDRGSDMLGGIKNFQLDNPNTRLTCDTSHRMANFLKSHLEKNERWKDFRKQVTQTRRKMQNSIIAGAIPPSPREKARFMNVGSLIEWAADMLLLLNYSKDLSKTLASQFSQHLSWLIDYKEDILKWGCLIEMGRRARHLVRNEGLHMDLPDHFINSIADLPLGKDELEYSDQIVGFFLEQTRGLERFEVHNGCSEVIETFFGKLKSMEKEQTAFGFTSLVLAALAHVGSFDSKMVGNAISKVKLLDIKKWSDKEIGQSMQSKRKNIRRYIAAAKIYSDTKPSGELQLKIMGF